MEEEIHLIINEQSLVPTAEDLNYKMTKTKKGHRILTLTTRKELFEESSVQF